MLESVQPLRDRLVLLIEGREALAEYIARGLKEGGALVLGPARSLDEANGLLGRLRTAPDAAVVSVDLFEAAGFIAGDRLARMGVPITLIAGRNRVLKPVTARWPMLAAPFTAQQVVEQIARTIGARHT